MTIGQRIKQLRTENKLTQKQLSQKLNLTPKMVSFYENNERIPPADILIKLSSIFNTSVDYILGISCKKESERFLQKFFIFLFQKHPDTTTAFNDFRESMGMTDDEFNTWLSDILNEKIDFHVFVDNVSKYLNVTPEVFFDSIPKTDAEKDLLNAFRKLTQNQKYIILGKTLEMVENNNHVPDPSVAAEGSKKTGTDNLGK